jgi:L-threonylcarbamoyladenylate synthase
VKRSVLPCLTIAQAVDALRAGAVIAYPTEAVYGLGCDPACEAAVRRILELKQRPASAGMILIGATLDDLAPFSAPITPDQRQQALAVWPGPVTWLFPRAAQVPDWLAGEHPGIALRVSAHPVCRALANEFGPVVSTSANPRAQPPARTMAEVESYFAGEIAGVVEGDLGAGDRPSEIRDLATGHIIRQG